MLPSAEPMTETELLATLEAEERDAVGYYRDEVAEAQAQSLNYYFGHPFGDELAGRSQVVSHDVQETVEWTLPELAQMFMGSDTVAEAVASGPDDADAADEATDYCNFVFLADNPGFQLWQDWGKDGLIQKIGVMRVDWEEPRWQRAEEHKNVSTIQLMEFQERAESGLLEILDLKARDVPQTDVYFDGQAYDLRVRERKPYGRCVLSGVAPEELLVRRGSRTLDEAAYRAHRMPKTVSDVIQLFPDKADEILEGIGGDDRDEDLDTRRQERFFDEEYYAVTVPRDDTGARPVILMNEFILVDYDGDGITELRCVYRVGDLVLYNEEVDEDCFAWWVPTRVPHKLFGLSQADQTMDLQRIKSVVWRSALDAMHQAVVPRVVAASGKVNIEDLLDLSAGKVVRADPNTSVRDVVMPLSIPDLSGTAFKMLEYSDQELEGRTGVTRYRQGLDPNALNKTATGIDILSTAGSGRLELIARNMADGLEMLFGKILRMLVRFETAERLVPLRGGKFSTIDPTRWNPEMHMRVHVGLGTGTRRSKIANLSLIIGKQEAILREGGVNNPLVSWREYGRALGMLTEIAGFKDASRFFKDVSEWVPPEEAEHPEVVKERLKLEAKAREHEAELAADIRRAEIESVSRERIAQAEIRSKERLAHMEAGFKLRLAALEKGLDAGGLDIGGFSGIETDVTVGGEPG